MRLELDFRSNVSGSTASGYAAYHELLEIKVSCYQLRPDYNSTITRAFSVEQTSKLS